MEVKELHVTSETLPKYAFLPITSIVPKLSPVKIHTYWVKQGHRMFLSQKDTEELTQEGLHTCATHLQDYLWHLLTPDIWGAWNLVLSRTLHHMSLHKASTLLLTSQRLWHPVPTSAQCFLICRGPEVSPSCLSEPCGSVANLLPLVILWLLGTFATTWFYIGQTAPHVETRDKQHLGTCTRVGRERNCQKHYQ